MQRQIIISDNLVTEIKKMLTHNKIGKHIAFYKDMMLKITVCLSIHPQTQELSPGVRLNPKYTG